MMTSFIMYLESLKRSFIKEGRQFIKLTNFQMDTVFGTMGCQSQKQNAGLPICHKWDCRVLTS